MDFYSKVKDQVSIYDLFDAADTPVRYLTKEKPCQISCPFHGADNKPSARVYPDSNSFRCYYCSQSWNSVTFWAQANNWYTSGDKLDIGKALDDLARIYNIDGSIPDWEKKFYSIRKSASEDSDPTERRKLANYYAWEITKRVHNFSPDERAQLREDVLSLWGRYEGIDVDHEEWKTDLKNWYSDAKEALNG